MSNFSATMWFMTLDMTIGYEEVPMTARAKFFSASKCPLSYAFLGRVNELRLK
ncbi:hypothetical protein F441_18170 [Phytophthora nicotianae CJ01A1]|uniref:Uncharacterized protein n=1 Tax=Phytophthora nicotianae CJ01A1 TaxID=1317063 RepID=W2W5C8_PHYNI|nr:hypothetical protein F441_18170 [Phytophthora nicotianae CJ01A1]